MELSKKYRIIADPNGPEKWAVELLDKKWYGIIYSYGSFEVKEPSHPDLPLKCVYERDIIYVPERFKGKKFSDEEGEDFKILLGQILMDVINDNMSGLTKKENKFVLEIKNDQ